MNASKNNPFHHLFSTRKSVTLIFLYQLFPARVFDDDDAVDYDERERKSATLILSFWYVLYISPCVSRLIRNINTHTHKHIQ